MNMNSTLLSDRWVDQLDTTRVEPYTTKIDDMDSQWVPIDARLENRYQYLDPALLTNNLPEHEQFYLESANFSHNTLRDSIGTSSTDMSGFTMFNSPSSVASLDFSHSLLEPDMSSMPGSARFSDNDISIYGFGTSSGFSTTPDIGSSPTWPCFAEASHESSPITFEWPELNDNVIPSIECINQSHLNNFHSENTMDSSTFFAVGQGDLTSQHLALEDEFTRANLDCDRYEVASHADGRWPEIDGLPWPTSAYLGSSTAPDGLSYAPTNLQDDCVSKFADADESLLKELPLQLNHARSLPATLPSRSLRRKDTSKRKKPADDDETSLLKFIFGDGSEPAKDIYAQPRDDANIIILRGRDAKLGYAQITQLIEQHTGRRMAESTARGRHRTMDVRPSDRRRNVKWTDIDYKLLDEGVRVQCLETQKLRRLQSVKTEHELNKLEIRWKGVSDYIKPTNMEGRGSRRFDGAACKKMFMARRGILPANSGPRKPRATSS